MKFTSFLFVQKSETQVYSQNPSLNHLLFVLPILISCIVNAAIITIYIHLISQKHNRDAIQGTHASTGIYRDWQGLHFLSVQRIANNTLCLHSV